MGGAERMIGPMSLVWTLGVPVAAVVFMAGALNLGAVLARATGSQVAMALFLPASVVLGSAAWMLVLATAWQIRRKYLRHAGLAMSATVVASDLRRKHSHSPLNFDLWRVRVEVRFPHPESGSDTRVRKQYSYPQFFGARARALTEQLGVGASVPVMVHKNSVLLDIPKRPIWADIW